MIKKYLLSGFLAGAGLIASGCIILDGAPTGEEYERSISPSTSRSDSWRKPGASEEQKRKDWIACGGKKTDFLPRLLTGSLVKILLYLTLDQAGNSKVA
ncbi:hypothetical protein [Paraburkholderia heleia]|uniref:hypothetical protein n=1 Tax=Paraburkholderia heleia TaxID=634127 RepID=UPI0012EEC10B|nr:hypothetical protein [Paraburkholderia heleia]